MNRARLPFAIAAVLVLAAFAGPSPSSFAAIDVTPRAAPVNEEPPTISGKPRVGQTLSASQGEWQGEPTSFFYQWLRCDSAALNCAPIADATGPQYLLTQADLGFRIRVEVVAVNADGASPAKRSGATGVVRVAVPTVISKPTIAGIPREGETLVASPGTWSGSPTSFGYTWKRCRAGQCVSVAGAQAPTYPLTGADVGARMRVRVVATNDGGHSGASSTSTATIQPAAAGFRLGHAKRDRRRGLARLRVFVPDSGTVTLARTPKVRGDSRRVESARRVKLTIKPRGRARRKLHRRGKVTVRARVTFAPDAGAASTRQRSVTLKQGR
jgi:hypothetical protein